MCDSKKLDLLAQKIGISNPCSEILFGRDTIICTLQGGFPLSLKGKSLDEITRAFSDGLGIGVTNPTVILVLDVIYVKFTVDPKHVTRVNAPVHGGDVASGRGGVVASGRGGVVASVRGGIGRADAMSDSEFQAWLRSGGGSFA